MNKGRTEQYRDRLQALASRVGATVSGLEEVVRTPTGGQSGGGLSNAPMHLGDVGTDVYNQELDATLLENEAFIRNETLEALNRIDGGTYGKCEGCGAAISAERLDALPYARHCAPCAGRLQSGLAVNLNNGRPATWLGMPGYEASGQDESLDRAARSLPGVARDSHAAGSPGGGTASGGLAGTNIGRGSPDDANLESAMGSGKTDSDESTDEGEDAPQAFSGPAGGAVGGTPANKRARGGKVAGGSSSRPAAKASPKKKAAKRKT